jgi:hypothetical protein
MKQWPLACVPPMVTSETGMRRGVTRLSYIAAMQPKFDPRGSVLDDFIRDLDEEQVFFVVPALRAISCHCCSDQHFDTRDKTLRAKFCKTEADLADFTRQATRIAEDLEAALSPERH